MATLRTFASAWELVASDGLGSLVLTDRGRAILAWAVANSRIGAT